MFISESHAQENAHRYFYCRQMKFAKVRFLHLSVSHSVHRGSMCGQGGIHGGGSGACMVGGMHGGGMCGRGHAWQGGMHGRGMHGGGHVWWGCAWQGACMAGQVGVHGRGACVVGACMVGMCVVGCACHTPPPTPQPTQTLGDMVSQCAGITHPTGMHSCFYYSFVLLNSGSLVWKAHLFLT